MVDSRIFSKYLAGIMVALCAGIALYLRIALPYDQVFSGEWIKFTGADAYSHMRLVDNLLQHFPIRSAFDPYTFYPQGAPVYYPPLFSVFLGGVIWLFGLGSPSPQMIDTIGAFFPAVLGALTVIPVYFIGRELFNRWVGVIAAGLVALLPGEFLGRTMLGFTDHHAAEVLFSVVAMLFLLLAIKTARRRQLTFKHLINRDWRVITRPLVYGLLAGLFLGNYLLVWAGGLLFVFIIFVYFVCQFLIDYFKHKSSEYLCFASAVTFLAAAVVTLPFLPEHYSRPLYFISLSVAILAPLVLSAVFILMAKRQIRPGYYLLSVVGIGVLGITMFYIIDPSLLKSMLANFGILAPSGLDLTIGEVQPLLFPDGSLSFSVAWANFTTSFFLSLIALGVAIYVVIKRGDGDNMFLVVWSLAILAVTLGQRRFAYYFAINVALLSGYLSWLILRFSGFREATAEAVNASRNIREGAKKRVFRPGSNRVSMTLGVVVVFFLVFFPNIKPAVDLTSQAPYAPADAWYESLSWLRENSPEPFGDPDFYYELAESPPPGENYEYPDSAYGVMAWWDYGHWITRIARRLPNHAPGGGRIALVADCFIAQDEASANKVITKLDSRYVVIDYATVIPKFHAISTWAGTSREEFFDVYHQAQDGKLVPIVLFYPEYYRSLVVRLYNFDGRE